MSRHKICDYCDSPFTYTNFQWEFNIEKIQYFACCNSCYESIYTELRYKTPHRFACFAKREGETFIFEGLEELKAWLEDKDACYRLGFYHNLTWKPRLRAQFSGAESYGVISDEERLNTIRQLADLDEHKTDVSVAWEGFTHRGSYIQDFPLSTPEKTLQNIKKFEETHLLEGNLSPQSKRFNNSS